MLGDVVGYLFLEFIIAKPIIEEYNSKTKKNYLIFLPPMLNIPLNIENNISKQSNIANDSFFFCHNTQVKTLNMTVQN